MEKEWPVQDAKARFAELLRDAQSGVQQITHRGEARAVVMSVEEYRRLTKRRGKSFYELWKSAPKVPDFELPPRDDGPMRDPGF